MAYTISLPTHGDHRGKLTVIEKVLPFEPKRVYFMYDVSGERGGHRHKECIQALVCIKGSCVVHCNDGSKRQDYLLDRPDLLLLVEPKDWHTMDSYTDDAVLLVLSSHQYDPDDYIHEDYVNG